MIRFPFSHPKFERETEQLIDNMLADSIDKGFGLGRAPRTVSSTSVSTTDQPAITLDTILKSMKRVREETTRGAVMDGFLPPGVNLVIAEDYPKMQLSADCPVSPKMREETNRWMVSFFGMTNHVPDGQVYMLNNGESVLMNRRTLATLRKAGFRA